MRNEELTLTFDFDTNEYKIILKTKDEYEELETTEFEEIIKFLTAFQLKFNNNKEDSTYDW